MAILRHTLDEPLPIVSPNGGPGIWALEVYTDISGHIVANPSLGIYIPSEAGECSLVASLAFPRQFLFMKDSEDKKAFCKTTALEALGILTAMCIDPFRFAGREVLFRNDNASTVIAFTKGYSRDPWTTAIVRASKVVAAELGATIFVTWEARRSSHGSIIADNLTHNILEGLSEVEVQHYLLCSRVSFPDPILQWMQWPGPDRAFGARIICWLSINYPALKLLFSS